MVLKPSQLVMVRWVLKELSFTQPDLILLAIKMPTMNGYYEVCEHLKTDKRTKDIPVIFVSALNETSDKVKAFTVGGVDYITKPSEEKEILARIENHLNLQKLQKNLQQKIIDHELAEEKIQQQHKFL